MPKKKDLKPSTILKNYWRDNEQFADLFNAVLFDGEQIIKPDELEEEDVDEDEYLSRMKRTDRFTPVITVLVYYGEKPWDGALSLHGILNIPEKMKPYINDYKVLLVEARENDLKLHNINNVDLFNMLEILSNKQRPLSEIRERAIAYAREHKVERSVMMTVAGAANCKIDYNLLEQEGGTDMWAVFEETKKEGILKGREEGREEGKEEIILAMLKAGYSHGEIARISNMTENEIKQIEKKSMVNM